ncbi:MAG: FAD-binding protein [Deltaproteobacteria bacterium]|nr:FAD-binding protein [Deltaproteobacteria bacterium]
MIWKSSPAGIAKALGADAVSLSTADLCCGSYQTLGNLVHPAYQQEERRTLRVGPNKGEFFQKVVAALLESHSMRRPEKVDLSNPEYDTDVLIIGGGAGASAALAASDGGANVIITTKFRHGDANTIMAPPWTVLTWLSGPG